MKTSKVFTAVMLLGVMTAATLAYGQPSLINFQGKFTGKDGIPESHDMTIKFTIYDSVMTGIPLWEETQEPVTVSCGIFNAVLGSVEPFPSHLFNGKDLWLEIEVNGEKLSPRKQITSAVYAIHAATANGDVGSGCWQCPNAPNGGPVYTLLGNVGIGTVDPEAKLHVDGNLYVGPDVDSRLGFGYGGPGSFVTSKSGGDFDRLHIRGNPVVFDQGDVGIGTDDPVADLEIKGSKNAELAITAEDCSDSAMLHFQRQQCFGGNSWHLIFDGPSSSFLIDEDAPLPSEEGYPQTRLAIKPGGNVGIGTEEPQTTLEVCDPDDWAEITLKSGLLGGGGVIDFADGGWGISSGFATPPQALSFLYEGHEVMTLRGDKVGIGTTDPKGPFQVGEGTFVVAPNNYVGIATDSPQKALDISVEDDGYAGLGICLNPNVLTGGTRWDIDNDEGVFKIVEHATCDLAFLDNTRIAVVGNCIGSQYGGNVGIGTGEPQTTLDVYDPDGWAEITLKSGLLGGGGAIDFADGGWEISSGLATEPQALSFSYEGDEVMTLRGDKVGIGTMTPGTKLHVAGSVRIDGDEGGSSGTVTWTDDARDAEGLLNTLQGASYVLQDFKVDKWLKIYVDDEVYYIPLFK